MINEFPATKMLAMLRRENLLPVILFRTSRKQCDLDIEKLASTRTAALEPEKQAALAVAIGEIVKKYQVDESVLAAHPHYQSLLRTGAGAHHAGQLLLWRLLLEELMSRGLLRMLIATGTVAAGVDFPARSVIITAHSKRGSEGFNIITASEFQQMSGRAGRRGKDAVGFCLVAPGTFSDARVIGEVSARPPEPLRSAYFAAPSTVLNLLKYRSAEDLRFTVSKSLAAFHDRRSAQGLRDEAEREERAVSGTLAEGRAGQKQLKRIRRKLQDAQQIEGRQLDLLERSLAGLEQLGYVKNGTLTEKGSWSANLCTSLVLELGEAIQDNLITEVDDLVLAGLIAAIAGDPHRKYFSIKMNPIKKDLYRAMQQIVERVRAAMNMPGAQEITVVPDAALTVITWLDCESWREFSALLRLSGAAEGDVARLVTQSADHLNQLSRLESTHPDLARQARELRLRLLRPPLSDAFVSE